MFKVEEIRFIIVLIKEVENIATFIGNFEDFKRFLGGYARNKVKDITRTPKLKRNKTCEECGKQVPFLESAHLHGKEREVIIRQILKKHKKNDNDEYIVDLYEFENKFINAHLPIEKNIKFLCRDCHKLYDKKFEKYNIPKEYTKSNTEDFQDFVKRILNLMFEQNLISNKEIELLKNKTYCKKTFSLEYPLLKDSNENISFSGYNRYWTTQKFGKDYFVCKEWWKQNFPLYEEKMYSWINKILLEHKNQK